MSGEEYSNLKNWLANRDVQKRVDQLAQKYKNRKIIIYGAGLLAEVLFDNYDLSGLDVIAVADMKFDAESIDFKSYKAIHPCEIIRLKPDTIFLAARASCPIKIYLDDFIFPMTGKIRVETLIKKSFKEKINDFYMYFPKS